MKRFIICILFSITATVLSCCSQQNVFTVEKYGESYAVNLADNTVINNDTTYKFEIDGYSDDCKIRICYPDGSEYLYTVDGNLGIGGWSEDFVSGKYTDGSILGDVISGCVPRKPVQKNLFLIILLTAVGAFYALRPKNAWFLSFGWRFKNAEPSELALKVNRFIGILIIVIAVVILFM